MAEESKNLDIEVLEARNAALLAELVVDPQTPDNTRVHILNKLLRYKANQTFFQTILEYALDKGNCPHCNFKTNWLIPETDLNQMGIVSHNQDDRVPLYTTAEDCPEFQEACQKKKINI